MAQYSDSRPILETNPNAKSNYNIVESVALSLTRKDWEKLVFLCNNFIEDYDETRILNSVEQTSSCTPEFNLKQLINAIKTSLKADLDEVDVLRELMYLIKKYRSLKLLGACHHQLAVTEVKYIPKLWVFLFNLVEELLDEPLKYIANHFNCSVVLSRRGFLLAKDIFVHLYKTNKITNDSVEALNPILSGYLKREDLVQKVYEFEKLMEQRYEITAAIPGRHCGMAVIFNHINFDKTPPPNIPNRIDLEQRLGTNIDAENLEKLWNHFGMETVVYRDFTSVELMLKIQELTRMDFSHYEIFVCCILSHGEEGYIYASDGVPILIEDIHRPFGEGVRSLTGPKLFFIQACQGDENNPLLPDAAPPSSEKKSPRPKVQALVLPRSTSPRPLHADMLIGISTVPGYRSWRSARTGSVYIKNLVEILLAKGAKQDLLQLMTLVNSAVSNTVINGEICQMPSLTSRLRRKLYLKPRVNA